MIMADSRSAAVDDGVLASEIDAANDLIGRGAKPEWRGEAVHAAALHG